MVANWRMEKLEVDSKSESEEEYFDCLGEIREPLLAKWSSFDLLVEENNYTEDFGSQMEFQPDSIFNLPYSQCVSSHHCSEGTILGTSSRIDDGSHESPPTSPDVPSCPTSILILIMHAGSVLDLSSEIIPKKSDVTTFRGAFESIMRQHYTSLVGHVAINLIPCPSICSDALGILSSLSPYSFDMTPTLVDIPNITDIPIGAVPLLTACSTDFHESVNRAIGSANLVYSDFLKTEEGRGFNGQIVLIGDSMGSVLAHDALCRANIRHDSDVSGLDHLADSIDSNDFDGNKLLTAPSPRRRSSSTSDSRLPKLDFDVSDFFIFGSPLAIILASRRLTGSRYANNKPQCSQIYNLFHPMDPTAARLEPLLSARFSLLAPINIPRYTKFPLGNGQSYHLLELIQSNPQIFNESTFYRRPSDTSIQSIASGMIDNILQTTIHQLQHRWWGSKRLDYALYCPEGLSNFPVHSLPHLFHASYWESSDVMAFILRQIGRFDNMSLSGIDEKDPLLFRPHQAREKWIKKRTSVKLKNVAANHRANDVILKENEPQRLAARFMYGPLDMITLAGERIDIYVMKDAPGGDWHLLSSEITDKTGRINYIVPEEKELGYGIYPIKMVVRGDHTSVDFYMAIVPPKTECVVFSIDGSFTASVSVTGKDPKVRAGAVDVCRHWQELGYLLVYITGRPDMQQQRVMSWLGQHNFPHGLISFADGLSTDPLGYKTNYLNNLIMNQKLIIHTAYGSSKDISVYTNIGLKAKQIFIVGKVSKKLQSTATPITEGYAAHLNSLMTLGGSRPAQGNARMVIPRRYFNFSGQNQSLRRRRFMPG